MAYDEGLAQRVREALEDQPGVAEKKMFGGLAFMVSGHMACGIVKDELMVRVGAAQHEQALARPGARPMDFSGKPMAGMVFVAPEGLESDAELTDWVDRGLTHARSLPRKEPKEPKPRRPR
jgi:TfoX/Sxy family transcriptional regulator of competence genes